MAKHVWPPENEPRDLTDSTLAECTRCQTTFGLATARLEGPDGERGPMGIWQGVWPPIFRRTLGIVFLGALLVVGLLLGVLAPGPAMAPLLHLAAASSSVHHEVSTPSPAAARSDGKAKVRAAPALDARFAIATLGVHCFRNLCPEPQVLAQGQRIYSAREGVTCTATSSVTVVGEGERFLYCRLEQPYVFAYSFDGAQFDCVGSRLGCHDVMIVDTTNGR